MTHWGFSEWRFAGIGDIGRTLLGSCLLDCSAVPIGILVLAGSYVGAGASGNRTSILPSKGILGGGGGCFPGDCMSRGPDGLLGVAKDSDFECGW